LTVSGVWISSLIYCWTSRIIRAFLLGFAQRILSDAEVHTLPHDLGVGGGWSLLLIEWRGAEPALVLAYSSLNEELGQVPQDMQRVLDAFARVRAH
jgi:hypothetical protein